MEKTHTKQEDYQQIIEFMATKDQGNTDELTRESLFQALVKEQHNALEVETRDDMLKGKLFGLQQLQDTIHNNSQRGLECLRLANYAPKDIKNTVIGMLQSKSKYLDYGGLAEYLAKRDYSEEFDPTEFIHEEDLFRDMSCGDALQGFYK